MQHVFSFWRAIEALTPQKLDKDNPDDMFTPSYKIEFGGVLPWDNLKHTRKPLPYGKVWRYTVQSGVYDLTAISTLLEEKIGPHKEVFEDRGNSQSRLFDISVNEHGIPQFESFMLSLPVWSAGQILQQEQGSFSLEQSIPADLSDLPTPGDIIPTIDSGFVGFDELTKHLMQWVADEAAYMRKERLKADLSWIIKLAEIVIEKTKFPRVAMASRLVCLTKCVQVKAPKTEQANETKTQESDDKSRKVKKETPVVAAADDLLNSFFIQELRHLGGAWQRKDVGLGFAEYMNAISQPRRQRIDIRSPNGLDLAFQRLLPTQTPAGAWPSNYPLAFSQQLAVNEIWRRNADKTGIFAVNGPPGTGKTTLLRDVVAAVVTQRAKKLIRCVDEAFSEKKSIKLGENWIPYFSLHSAIKGSSIVVASANNGAVENISLELPGEEAVPKSVLSQSDYFAGLVSELIGKPGWGLLAARLGNKSNRDEFLKIFWWRKPEEKQNDTTLPPDTFTPKRGEGLAYHLQLIRDGIRTPAIQWCDAVSRFQKAQAHEETIRNRLIEYSMLNEQISELRLQVKETTDARELIVTKLTQARAEWSEWDAKVTQLEEACNDQRNQMDIAEHHLMQHESHKPGFLAWISTLGRAHREWWERYHRLTRELDLAREGIDPQQKALASTKIRRTDIHDSVAKWESELRQADGSLDQVNNHLDKKVTLFKKAQSAMGHFWPNPSAQDDEREKSAPWAYEDWRKARERLFLAALDIHRAFIETHPREMLSNLYLASNWLQGKNIPEAQAALALESLSLIIPVISTTFASIPRMFKKIDRETIGWLLIDEAGQALPQQAAGAIWRAARTVVVGDPKQLEPVSGISPIVEGALAQHYGVPSSWWPSEVSAQVLADQTMDLGTRLPDEDKGKTVWVGCPLRVHRRCDDPMFTVSNTVAYDGLMVHGKKETPTPLPQSCWIDIVGKHSEGNWIVEEGVAVKKLLTELRDVHNVATENIFLISPFKDCARKLWQLAANLGFNTKKTGTVHTTQGKEASVVVFVLGGNVQKPGARAWAASRPNLLNVAVSRAKQRLYVIGSRSDWQKYRYFSTLAKNLPTNPTFSAGIQVSEDVLH